MLCAILYEFLFTMTWIYAIIFENWIIHAIEKLLSLYTVQHYIVYIKREKFRWKANTCVDIKTKVGFQFPMELKTVFVCVCKIYQSLPKRAMRVQQINVNQYRSTYHSSLYETKTIGIPQQQRYPRQSSSIFIKLCINMYTHTL